MDIHLEADLRLTGSKLASGDRNGIA
jgi:hypothetical protein